MLKRNVSVAVAAALALSLAACGSSPASSAASSEAVSSEAASSEATAAPAAGDFDVDQDITVISREDGSGTRGAFIELTGVEAKNDAGEKVDNTTEAAAIQSSTNGVLTAVSNDETAIGYISLGSLNNDVKAVTVEGVAPSADTVRMVLTDHVTDHTSRLLMLCVPHVVQFEHREEHTTVNGF